MKINKRVLVIDDEASIRSLMKKILSRAGYTVFTASGGRESIELLETIVVDLIILDMNMPDMNGLEVLKYLRSKHITGKPVLMMSGVPDSELRAESYKLGAYDFITKPEQTEVMLKRIENGIKIGEMSDFNDFMKVELFMAKKLQKYIFPEPFITTENISIHSWSQPLSDIGGDLYDYIHFRENRVMFFIADVSGHSVSASMFTAIVKMVFRNALKMTDDPGEVMTILNRELSANLPVESFVTSFCGLIDGDTGMLHYSNAGHPNPMIIKGDSVEELEGSGPFLGPIKEQVFAAKDYKIEEGDRIFLFTDGLTDIISDDFMQINPLIFAEILKNRKKPVNEVFEELVGKINSPEYIRADDCTVMVIEKKGPASK
jgi:sigma-B regulation protein RsbU (phosphoserine phosphatase)